MYSNSSTFFHEPKARENDHNTDHIKNLLGVRRRTMHLTVYLVGQICDFLEGYEAIGLTSEQSVLRPDENYWKRKCIQEFNLSAKARRMNGWTNRYSKLLATRCYTCKKKTELDF